jgi:predicted ATP-grasp superfamily ATP-dependent carboligase
MAGTLVLAGLSVRLMAESARRAGFDVVALDLFGDRDTRRAAAEWHAIGAPAGLRLDPARVLAALQALRRRSPAPLGWIAGAGFEALPEALQQGAAELPLLGTPAAQVQALRTPAVFFAALAGFGLPHPRTQLHPPADPAGWLAKDFGSSGGWHVRRVRSREVAAGPPPYHAASPVFPVPPPAADARPGGPYSYYQQVAPGEPMSALFIANGQAAQVLGHQHQFVAAIGVRPCVWQGVAGPVPPAAAAQAVVDRALAALVPRFGLRGLGSLDYLLDGDAVHLLEINPRPPASMALYDSPQQPSLVDMHLRACLNGALPDRPQPPRPPGGQRVVFARRAGRLDAAQLDALEARGWCHDLAARPTRFERGDPVCTVSADAAADLAAVRQQLAARTNEIEAMLADNDPGDTP